MTPVVFLAALGFVALGGLAWITTPLLRETARRLHPRSHGLSDDVQRSLNLMDDLDLEQLRGSVSDAEHAELTAELRQQAALALDAQQRGRARAAAQVEALVSDRPTARASATPATPSPAAVRRPVLWLLTAATLVGGLVAIVLVVTLGARQGVANQTAVGNVGVAAITAAAVSPADPEILVAAHPSGLQVSRDAAATWQSAEFPRTTRWVATTPTGFVALTDDGPFRGDNLATGWTPWAASLDLVHLASGRQSGRLVGIDASGAVHTSDDDGASWRTLEVAAPPNVTGIAVVDQPEVLILLSTATEGVLATSLSGPWRSANGFVNGALPTVNVRSLHYEPNSGDRYISPTGREFQGAVYLATDAGVFKTVDGTQSWHRLPLAADIVAIAGSAAAPRELYAIARDGTVFRSRDLGASWG